MTTTSTEDQAARDIAAACRAFPSLEAAERFLVGVEPVAPDAIILPGHSEHMEPLGAIVRDRLPIEYAT